MRALTIALLATAVAALPARGECPGDCDGDGAVAINELIVLVDIGLDGDGADRCSAGDRDGDGMIAIDEIVAAVAGALDGCPTPTSTDTVPPSPAPTREPSATHTIEPSPTASTAPTLAPSPTATATALPSDTATARATPTATAAPSSEPSPSATASVTPVASPSATASMSQTANAPATSTATPPPSATASGAATPSFTFSPTATASAPPPTATFTATVSAPPTATPSASPPPTATPSRTGTPTRTGTATRTATASTTATPTRTATRSVTRTATASFTRTGTFTRTATPTRTFTGTPQPTATVTATGTVTATASGTPTRTATLTGTPTRTGTATASVTPTPGLGTRRFSLAPASSALRLLPDQGTLTGFEGYLELTAGAPDPVSGVAPVHVTGGSTYLSIALPGMTLCIRPLLPLPNAGVVACAGGLDLSINSGQDHNIGVVGVDGFTVADCDAAGGILELGPADPHPGVCNGPLVALGSEVDSGAGALLIAPDERFGTQGLPAEVTFASGPCESHGSGSQILFGFSTGASRAEIVDANNAPGVLLAHDEVGENFDCGAWMQENGPGRLVLSVPAVHGAAPSGDDVITVFVFDD